MNSNSTITMWHEINNAFIFPQKKRLKFKSLSISFNAQSTFALMFFLLVKILNNTYLNQSYPY